MVVVVRLSFVCICMFEIIALMLCYGYGMLPGMLVLYLYLLFSLSMYEEIIQTN